MKIKRLFICFYFLQISFVLFSQQTTVKNERIIKFDSLFKITKERLSAVDLTNAENIPLLFIQIPDIKNVIDTLDQIGHDEGLYNLSDSNLTYRSIALLSVKFDSIRKDVEDKMKKIDLVMYNAGLQSLGIQDTTTAIKYFKKSTAYNPSYSPSWYQLVKIHNKVTTINLAEAFLSDALRAIDTVTNPYNAKLWKQCAREVFFVFLQSNSNFIRSEDYFKALKQLEQIGLFCNIHKVPDCADSVQFHIQQAKTGMFQSYIKIARRAIDNHRFEMANEYISKAEKYYQENSFDISTGYLLKEITDYHASIAIKSAIVKDKSTISNQKTTTRKKSVHNTRRKRSRIDRTIDTELNAAKRSSIQILKDTTSGWYPSKEQKDSVLQHIRLAYYLAWKNNLDSANTIYQRTNESLVKLQLAKDGEVLLALVELRKRIDDQKMFNTISVFQNYLNQSINYFNRKKYAESEEMLFKAENWYNINKVEGLNDSLLNRCKNDYKEVFAFESEKKLMYENLLKGNWDKFLDRYSSISILHNRIQTAGYENDLIPLDSLLRMSNQSELIKISIHRAIETENAKSALYRLSLLKQNSYQSKLCIQEQRLTAQLIAKKDFKMDTSPKQSLNRLQLNGKWYKMFRKEYNRKFQELLKSSTHEKSLINQ
jgi:hypothetical protein